MSARAIMVLGTASHVGKSVLTAALCRILADRGLRVAPFKAQNMSLESAATPDGLEIGRAQAMQAEAARIPPSVDMNPILLKPTTDSSSQVVVLGKVRSVERAVDYHTHRTREYFSLVVDAYRRLAERNDVIVLEGAGSPAEINLKATDIVNMRMAEAADARCLLVGDIDRGGVFASLLGTMELLDPNERARIAAFAINKFRGDLSLLEPGVAMISERIGIPCAGVVPWLRDLGLDEEDSVSLEDVPHVSSRDWRRVARSGANRALRVAVVKFPHLSNGTDFKALAAEPDVDVAYATKGTDLDDADLTILPGSKQTFDDLRWMRETGIAEAIVHFASRGFVLGICGGMQMLGATIEDPYDVEGGGSESGLDLLAIDTELAREKITENVLIRIRAAAALSAGSTALSGSGYEIHMGSSHRHADAHAFAQLERRDGVLVEDGCVSSNGRISGTYVHGLLANDTIRHTLVRTMRDRSGLVPPANLRPYTAERESRFDRLAAHVRASLSLDALLPS